MIVRVLKFFVDHSKCISRCARRFNFYVCFGIANLMAICSCNKYYAGLILFDLISIG